MEKAITEERIIDGIKCFVTNEVTPGDSYCEGFQERGMYAIATVQRKYWARITVPKEILQQPEGHKFISTRLLRIIGDQFVDEIRNKPNA